MIIINTVLIDGHKENSNQSNIILLLNTALSDDNLVEGSRQTG